MIGSIDVVGIGPGSPDWLAPAARRAIEGADVILGYKTYIGQLGDIATGVERERSGMRGEVARVRRAIELAREGRRVALVSGGDAGVYGMAGLLLEVLAADPHPDVPVTVLPGITALTAAAALLGAPLMSDFAAVSLSDHLTPLEAILERVELAVRAGFVLCLYNPRSHKRTEPYRLACEAILRHRDPGTPCGVVRAAYRDSQEVQLVALADLAAQEVGMDAIVVVGGPDTRVLDGRLVTARGYERKYDLEGGAA
ncbi:MAG: precorrin-3B C(17)-methyltransferase [Candidatus Limnocylindrales bacterium]